MLVKIEKLEPLCTVGGMVKWSETIWRFLRKLNIELLYDPAILFLSIYLKHRKQDLEEIFSYHVHSSQEVKATWMSSDGWMVKQNLLYTLNRLLLFILERNPVTCYTVDAPWGHYAKWNMPITGKILHDPTHMGYL